MANKKNKSFDLGHFVEEFNELDIESLGELNSIIIKIIKNKKQLLSISTKNHFNVGDEVKLNPKTLNLRDKDKHFFDKVFVVEKFGRTKIHISVKDGFVCFSVAPCEILPAK